MMARLWWYLDPISPQGPPQTKPGSAHGKAAEQAGLSLEHARNLKDRFSRDEVLFDVLFRMKNLIISVSDHLPFHQLL